MRASTDSASPTACILHRKQAVNWETARVWHKCPLIGQTRALTFHDVTRSLPGVLQALPSWIRKKTYLDERAGQERSKPHPSETPARADLCGFASKVTSALASLVIPEHYVQFFMYSRWSLTKQCEETLESRLITEIKVRLTRGRAGGTTLTSLITALLMPVMLLLETRIRAVLIWY